MFSAFALEIVRNACFCIWNIGPFYWFIIISRFIVDYDSILIWNDIWFCTLFRCLGIEEHSILICWWSFSFWSEIKEKNKNFFDEVLLAVQLWKWCLPSWINSSVFYSWMWIAGALCQCTHVSYFQVLSQRISSTLRRSYISSFRFRGSSSAKVFTFLTVTRYSTYLNDEFPPSSKRRSRGPIMAAKKASKGA